MTNAKIRRSGRMYREIPIQLLGTAADGAVSVEEPRTVIRECAGNGFGRVPVWSVAYLTGSDWQNSKSDPGD